MAQPGKTFKNRIDSIADPELLETERRSLQRLLVATRDAKQFREAAAKTAWSGKVDNYKLCLAQDRVAAHYRKTTPAAKPAAAPSAVHEAPTGRARGSARR